MSRPQKQTVDYFPHMTKSGKTLFILERQFQNDGYAFWYKLLEILGATEGHAYDLRDDNHKTYLWAYTNVSEEMGVEILKVLCKLEAIDPELYESGVIWSDNFVEFLSPLYRKRVVETPIKPVVSGGGNPQRKEKKRKEKKKKTRLFKSFFPEPWIENTDFATRCDEWDGFRKDKRMPRDETTYQKQANKLLQYPIESAIIAIDDSIQSGWQGLFPKGDKGVKDDYNPDNWRGK
jgi:hypothetical protein